MISRILLLLVTFSLAPVSLTACNTIQGAGQDVESAGSAIKEEAREHKKY